MKILLHSNLPGSPSGYGQQAALFVPRIASLGHEVAVSAFYSTHDTPPEWEGHKVYPPGRRGYGEDVLAQHARHFGADLVITLMDVWALGAEPVRELRAAGVKVAQWMPVDCSPLSMADRAVLEESRAVPIAMSRFGERMLTDAGFKPLYVPHGIDCSVFKPPEDRKALREAMGIADQFVVGINAANKELTRKAWPEQMAAFARLHKRHPGTRLYAHTVRAVPGGLDLGVVAQEIGIKPAVMWSDQDLMKDGLITPAQMAATTGAADLWSGCSMAEGFGLPVLEAQACGTPTVVTDWSAMSEVGCGWKVGGEPMWAPLHHAWWCKPSIGAIARAYEKAYERGPSYQAKARQAREHALTYDADRVLKDWWVPCLEHLEAMP